MNTQQKLLVRSVIAAVAIAGMGHTHSARAEQAALEEVVVSARKKDETIQDVPLAVSAISRDSVEAAFMIDSTAITQFAPNVVFDEIAAGAPGGGGISIRGISFQDVEKTFDPAVLVYLDEIALGTNTGNVMNMLDVERIEVLRGPQGTLFGKNAVGGVISIHRIKPIIGQWAGKARVRAGNYERLDVEGVLNIPLGDTLAAKLSVARLEQNEGFYKNIIQNREEGDNKEERFGIHLLWSPIENLNAEFQYNQSEADGTSAPMLAINSDLALFCAGFGVCAASDDEPYSGDRRKGAGEARQGYFIDTKDYTLNVAYDLNDAMTATVIYGHREIDDAQDLDFDGSPLPLFTAFRTSEYEQDSLELRFDYDAGEDLSVTGGYYYWNAETGDWKNELEIPLLLAVPPGTCGHGAGQLACRLQQASAESESNSFFFEGDYSFTDNWVLTLGGRWIEEKKTMTSTDSLPFAGAVLLPPTKGSRKDDDFIYRIGVRYEVSADLMVYLMQSTGFRSGGFSIRAATPEVVAQGYEPETVKNLELGIKSTLMDGRVRLNGAIFRMDYKDMQQEINIAGGPSGQQDTVVNASSATLQGFELEADVLLSDAFRMDLNIGYLDAEYDKFVGSIFADQVERDVSYLPLRRAPEWNYTLGLNYTQPIGAGTLLSSVSYNWRDNYAGTATDFPGTHIDDFGLLDLSVTYKMKQWQIAAFGRNLTDEDEYSHTFAVAPQFNGSSLFTFATPRPPRTFGVEVQYSFGSY